MGHHRSSLLREVQHPKNLDVRVGQKSLRVYRRSQSRGHHRVVVLARLEQDCFLEGMWVAVAQSWTGLLGATWLEKHSCD
jgi:hypothetical protein